ncbi:MAG: mucin-associated surface protein [Micromonosporaceae bacterium]|nr:mucin-associated surface protein [Micromonosporaceae bacterium]
MAGDVGAATVEIAACLPALALLLMVGLGALAVVRDQIGCVAAAREIALAAARGASPPSVEADVVEVSADGDVVRVVVRRHRNLGILPGFDITATAVAAIEPDQ